MISDNVPSRELGSAKTKSVVEDIYPLVRILKVLHEENLVATAEKQDNTEIINCLQALGSSTATKALECAGSQTRDMLSNFEISLTIPKDEQSSPSRSNESFSSCLCDFYGVAKKEILIFSPDFSDEIFTDSVTDVLAAKVEEGVRLKIIVKNSKNFGSERVRATFNGLVEKLSLKGIHTDDLGQGNNHELIVNSGKPTKASRLFESCNSAFSIIDNTHYRYRDISNISRSRNDYGVFVFFAEGDSFARKFLNVIREELFPRFSRIVLKGQSRKKALVA